MRRHFARDVRWRAATVALTGAVVGALTDAPPGQAWALALAAASLALAVDRPALRRGLILAALACAACGHAAGARDFALAPPIAQWFAASGSGEGVARPRRAVVLTGRLLADAVVTAGGALIQVRVSHVEDDHLRFDLDGIVRITVAGGLAGDRVDDWRAGRRVTIPVTLREVSVRRNPGSRSPRWQALTRGFALAGTAKSALVVAVERGRFWDEAAASVRAGVRRALRQAFAKVDAPQADESRAIVTAILIGDRSGLNPETDARLRAAGTYHVVAISGGNVALVAAVAFLALRSCIRTHRLLVLMTVLFVAAYGWIVGGDPSVFRAVTAASVYLMLSLAGWRVSPLNVIAVVVLIMIAVDPLAVVDAGAWLTFGATVGIVLIASGLTNTWAWQNGGLRFRLGRALGALVLATAAAELVLLPVHASVFNRIGIAGLALNAIAIPSMAVVQVAGALAAALAVVWAGASGIVAFAAHAGARALVGFAALVELAPWTSWRVPTPPVAVVVLFYAALAAALRTPTAVSSARRWWGHAAVAVLVVWIATAPDVTWRQPRADRVRLTMLDVGQGDALVVQAPGGRALLIDAGGAAGRFDVGERVIAPALWALGVRRLDWLVVTHPDLDHIGGASSVVTIFEPAEMWEGVPVFRDAGWLALRAQADARARPWRRLQQGDVIELGDLVISVAWPPAPDWERQRTRNDDSVVLRVRYREVEWLLTGDVGTEVERAALAAPATARLRFLKMPHHGSRTSSSAALIDGYRPHLAFVSVGAENPFGHPAADVLDRYLDRNVPVLRTDRSGAIVMESDGHEVRIRTQTGKETVWRVVQD